MSLGRLGEETPVSTRERKLGLSPSTYAAPSRERFCLSLAWRKALPILLIASEDNFSAGIDALSWFPLPSSTSEPSWALLGGFSVSFWRLLISAVLVAVACGVAPNFCRLLAPPSTWSCCRSAAYSQQGPRVSACSRVFIYVGLLPAGGDLLTSTCRRRYRSIRCG
jgi:hypothetical protein